jgi:Zn-dependent protease
MFLLSLLQVSPLLALAWAVALIVSLTVHEFAHALVGKLKGDDTAEKMGRLSLNPFAHLDALGTIMLLTLGFGWAKPVPFDPRKLKHPLKDGVLIALAGPASNLFLAVLAAAAFRSLLETGTLNMASVLPAFLVFVMLVNMFLLFFNLIPVPPLDGSRALDALLYELGLEKARAWLEIWGPRIMLGLVILSLVLPINVFFFVQIPSFIACDAMAGVSCNQVLGTYLGG